MSGSLVGLSWFTIREKHPIDKKIRAFILAKSEDEALAFALSFNPEWAALDCELVLLSLGTKENMLVFVGELAYVVNFTTDYTDNPSLFDFDAYFIAPVGYSDYMDAVEKEFRACIHTTGAFLDPIKEPLVKG